MNQFPQHVELKDGSPLAIRIADKTDAANLISYVKQIAGETNFLTFAPEDFNKSVEEEEKIIESYANNQNQIFLIAEKEGAVVGLLDVHAKQKPRLKHIGEIGISVLKSEWGNSVGTKLMEAAIDWAKTVGLRKLNLNVDTSNERAIALYERFGFEVEGTLRRDGLIGGKFRDAHMMGLLID